MLRNQDLNLLPIFDALIQEQQLSRAAERLSMSQPAVSNALKRLRLSYGDDLFVRTGRGLRPTQRALELHAMISPGLGLIRQSFEDQAFTAESFERIFDISMNSAVEFIWAADFMARIRDAAPRLKLRIHPDYLADIPGRLKDGRLSYAIEYLPLPPEHFESQVLLSESLCVICAADHPVLRGEISREEFQALSHVSLVPRSSLVPAQNSREGSPIEQLLGADVPERNVALQVSSFVAVPMIVATSDLIATVPRRLAQPLAQQGKLQMLDLPFAFPEIELSLYWHKSRNNDPSHKWMLTQILEAIQAL